MLMKSDPQPILSPFLGHYVESFFDLTTEIQNGSIPVMKIVDYGRFRQATDLMRFKKIIQRLEINYNNYKLDRQKQQEKMESKRKK